MKITKVEGLLLSCPFDEPIRLPFFGGERTILKRDAMLIRVTADNGLKGFAPGPAHERAAREIAETIGPFLEGRDPTAWSDFGFAADAAANSRSPNNSKIFPASSAVRSKLARAGSATRVSSVLLVGVPCGTNESPSV